MAMVAAAAGEVRKLHTVVLFRLLYQPSIGDHLAATKQITLENQQAERLKQQLWHVHCSGMVLQTLRRPQ
jgi:hypothetical protein